MIAGCANGAQSIHSCGPAIAVTVLESDRTRQKLPSNEVAADEVFALLQYDPPIARHKPPTHLEPSHGGSPFFGQPTNVLNPRKIDFGSNFGF